MRAESSGKAMTAGASTSRITSSFINAVVAELLVICYLFAGLVVGGVRRGVLGG